MKINLKSFILLFMAMAIFTSCGDDEDNNLSTCSDGIQNGSETGIDCGGTCDDCFTCTDGIQNGNETGIDCGGDCPDACNTEPSPNAAYYMKFKLDGIWKLYEIGNPGYQSNLVTCGYFVAGNVLGETDRCELNVCDIFEEVDRNVILSWDDEPIIFDQSTTNIAVADLFFDDNGERFGTENGSEGMIEFSSIDLDGTFVDYEMFKCTGTFECTVTKIGANTTHDITEGTFVARFSENY